MQEYIKINMSEMSIAEEAMPTEYESLGGRGLIAKILNGEIDPKCDAVGEGNKLIVCPGLLSGTSATTANRLSIGGKSPLTGGIKEANVGGNVASLMSKLGVKLIVVSGKPKKSGCFILHVTTGGAELVSADDYSGINTYELFEKLKGKYGDKCGILGIGTAGERLYSIASVQGTSVDGYPTRAAARGGLGAVMGSKGLKAIVFDSGGEVKVEYADKAKFNEANKILVQGIMGHPATGGGMPALGTASLVNPVNAMGALPTRNFSSGQFEGAEKISGEYIAELQAKRGITKRHACQPGCVIKCSMDYNDENGEFLTSGMEYETLGLMGANLGIDDVDAIARLDRMCDDLGVDTMDAGIILGVCMEGGKASFGDVDGAFALMKELVDGSEFGKIMAKGADYVGKTLGVKRIPTVKRQGMAAYEPRAIKGNGVAYAVSTMGADHTTGNLLGHPALDPVKKDGTIPVVTGAQISLATGDTIGVCLFATLCWGDPNVLQAAADLLGSRFGDDWSVDRLLELGVTTLKREKEFNRKAGITSKEDALPEFMYNEPLPPTGTVFDFTAEELAEVLPY